MIKVITKAVKRFTTAPPQPPTKVDTADLDLDTADLAVTLMH